MVLEEVRGVGADSYGHVRYIDTGGIQAGVMESLLEAYAEFVAYTGIVSVLHIHACAPKENEVFLFRGKMSNMPDSDKLKERYGTGAFVIV